MAKLSVLCISPFHLLYADQNVVEDQGQWSTWHENDIKELDYQLSNSFS